VDVLIQGGLRGRGVAPAGASRGEAEAIDLRDGGHRFGGYDVQNALAAVRGEIAETIIGLDVIDQRSIDETLIALDGTPNRSRLGGNAMVATSMAVLRAAASAAGEPLWRYLADGKPVRLPLPEIQIFGGGVHAARRVDIQDFLVMPVGAESFTQALEMVADVYAAAGELMVRNGPLTGVADEGGYWPNFDSNEDALTTLTRAIEAAGYGNGEVMISLDIAASQFYEDGHYKLGLDDHSFDTGEWIEVLASWIGTYPILSIEDPVNECDRDGMIAITQLLGDKLQIIGDDYLVTSTGRVQAAQAEGAGNAVLLKPNQVGTITETLDALVAARATGWGTVVSARSGETEDDIISDLSVGWNAGQLKVGSITRSERTAKWNQVLRIEEMLGDKAVYAGRSALPQALQ